MLIKHEGQGDKLIQDNGQETQDDLIDKIQKLTQDSIDEQINDKDNSINIQKISKKENIVIGGSEKANVVDNDV